MLDDLPESLTAHPLAVHVDEQRCLFAVGNKLGADVFRVVPDSRHSGVVERDDPLPIPSPAADETRSQIQVLQVQGDQLADPDAGGVKQLQHGVVPVTLGIHALRLLQKQLHLLGGQDLRVLPLHPLGGDALGRICLYGAGGKQELVKRLDRGQKPGDGSGRFALPLHPAHVLLNHLGSGQVYLAVLVLRQILCKLRHIPQIGADRIG